MFAELLVMRAVCFAVTVFPATSIKKREKEKKKQLAAGIEDETRSTFDRNSQYQAVAAITFSSNQPETEQRQSNLTITSWVLLR